MTPSLTALLVGTGCAVAHAALTLVLLRLPGRLSPVARHAASAGVTHAAGVVTAGLTLGPLPYWPIAAASGFGAVVWLFAFSAVYKSVSLRILAQLATTPGHAMPFDDVTTGFVLPEFQARVRVLEVMGAAEAVGEAYALTAKGTTTAARLVTLQRISGIDRSGLYGGIADAERVRAV